MLFFFENCNNDLETMKTLTGGGSSVEFEGNKFDTANPGSNSADHTDM